MRLLIRDTKVIGTASDDYTGTETSIIAPEGFDTSKSFLYTYNNDILSISTDKIWENIKAYRDKLTITGGFPVNDKWFHSDTFSRTQQLGLVMMGAGVPAVQWKTMDGTFVEMTQTLAGQIFTAAATQDQALFTHAEVLHAAVLEAEDPNTVDINAGWPETYQGP